MSLQVLILSVDAAEIGRLRALLRSMGHEAAVCDSDATALAQIQFKRPDAILLDVEPSSTHALDLVRHIRRTPELKDLYAVALLRSIREEQEISAYEAGVDNELRKPVTAGLLGARLRVAERNSTRNTHLAAASPKDRVSQSASWAGLGNLVKDTVGQFLGLAVGITDGAAFYGEPPIGCGILLSNPQDQLEIRISIGTNEPGGRLLGKHMFGDGPVDVGTDLLGELSNLAMGVVKTALGKESFAFTGGLPEQIGATGFFHFTVGCEFHQSFTISVGGARLLLRAGLGTRGRTMMLPSALAEGMILTKDVFNLRGSLLIRGGTRLSTHMIELLNQSLPPGQQVDVMPEGE